MACDETYHRHFHKKITHSHPHTKDAHHQHGHSNEQGEHSHEHTHEAVEHEHPISHDPLHQSDGGKSVRSEEGAEKQK